MAKMPERYTTCVLCETQQLLTPYARCGTCGAVLTGPASEAVATADRAIATLSRNYEIIAAEWRQWLQYRDYYAKALEATRPAPMPADAAVTADAAVGSVPAPTAAPAETFAAPESVAEPTPQPQPQAQPQPQPAPQPEPARAPEPAPASGSTTVPGPQPAPSGPAPRRRLAAAADSITAPVLLGVAGAALLIAAAVVFVALAWTTFTPATRGAIVLAVAFAVSGLAVWVRRLGLEVTSGAIGVVAMGFAGAASIAFFRDSGTLGSFDLPAALLFACLAGVLLARLGIPWVGPAAALALAGATVGFTVAATATANVAGAGGVATANGLWVWTLTGTVAAAGLAATRRMWKWRAARTLVTWSAVIWLGFVGVSVPVWMWARGGEFADAVVGLAPVAALIVLARWWPRLAVGPAALILTLLPAAAVDVLGGGVWPQMTAAAVAVGVMLALGPWAPRVVLWPLLIGVSPAYVTVAIASTIYSVMLTVARILAGTYVPDTNMWAGVAALVAGLSIAQLRLWRVTSPWLSPVSVVGALMTVVGGGIAGFGIAELTGPPLYHSSVAAVMTVVACGLLAMLRAWSDPWARRVSEWAALCFLLTAVLHGTWALVISEILLVFALMVALAPLAVLVARGRISPWWGMPAGVVATLALAGGLAARYDAAASLIVVAMLAAAAAVAWVAWRTPRRLHAPILAGLAVAGTLVIAPIAGVLATVANAVGGVPGETVDPLWSVGVLVFGLGLAAARNWRLPRSLAVAAAVAGASFVLFAAVGFAADAAVLWGHGRPGLPAAYLLGAAAASALTTPLWREKAAAWTTGIGATVLAVLAGVGALLEAVTTESSPAVPLAVAAVAVVLLAVPARRYPQVTLAPSVALGTGLAWALVVLTEASGPIAIASAAALAAALMWLPWGHRLASFVTLGALPALAAATITGVTGVLFAVYSLCSQTTSASATNYTGVVLALGALAVASWRLPHALAWRRPAERRHDRATARTLAAACVVAMDLVATALVWTLTAGDAPAHLAGRIGASATAIVAGAAIAWATRAVPPGALSTQTLREARWCAFGWAAAMALLAVFDAATSRSPWYAAVAICAVTIGALAAGWRWWPRAVAVPMGAIASLAPLALLGGTGMGVDAVGLIIAAIVASCLWLARRARPHVALGIRWGLAPAGAGLAVAVGAASVNAAAIVLARAFRSDPPGELTASLALLLLVSAIGAAALPRLGGFAPQLVLCAVLVASAALPALVAGLVAAVLAVAVALWGERLRLTDSWAAAVVVISVVWGVGDAWALTAAGASAVAVGVVAARRQVATPKVWASAWLLPASGLLCGALAESLGAHGLVAAITMAGVGAGAVVAAVIDAPKARLTAPWFVGAATVVLPWLGHSATGAGATLVVASAVWFLLVTRGVSWARWCCAATASIGVAIIMAGADVTAVEAYTMVPALAALALGLQWMRERPDLPSLPALGPGLAIALVPSYVALVREPDSLARTAWLTVVMVVLALVAVRLRWFAPVVATAATALVVAGVQVLVGTNLVLRMVAFIVVGSLLLAFASWFERLKTLR